MSSAAGSVTPCQQSDITLRAANDKVLVDFDGQTIEKEALLNYIEQCSYAKHPGTTNCHERATWLLTEILESKQYSQGLARASGIIPWPSRSKAWEGKIKMCPLPASLVPIRDAARSFQEHPTWKRPTEATATKWRDHLRNMTILANEYESRKGRTVAELLPDDEQTEMSLAELNTCLADIEGRILDVMFPGPVDNDAVANKV